MNILIIHEIDWEKKVPFEPHHFAELFSLQGNNVYVIDCPSPNLKNLFQNLKTQEIKYYSKLYKNSNITLIHPPSILIKGLNRITHFLAVGHVIERVIFNYNIDAILLYGSATNGIQTIQVARKFKKPVIFRMLDIGSELVSIPIVKNQAKKNEKFVIKNSDLVLTTTPNMKNYVINIGAKNNVEYFPLGVNTKIFKNNPNDELRKTLRICKNDKILLFVGTLYRFSGLRNIILRFETIKKKIPYIKLIIIGDGPEFQSLQSLVKKLNLQNYVLIVGRKPQNILADYISLSDLCINPFQINSITNSIMPVKILEYLACAKPVLSTPLKGTIEILENETSGVVYSEEQDFVENIITLLKNPTRLSQLGSNGFSYIQSKFDIERQAEKLINKFEKLL